MKRINIVVKETRLCQNCEEKATFDFGEDVEVTVTHHDRSGTTERENTVEWWCKNCLAPASNQPMIDLLTSRGNVARMAVCEK